MVKTMVENHERLEDVAPVLALVVESLVEHGDTGDAIATARTKAERT
jgi:hypothetical protein